MTRGRQRIVIVGAGLAGLRAAERLRELRFDGDILIVGDEPYAPYHRPALSKQVLTQRGGADDITLRSYVDLGDCWRIGTRAWRLAPGRHVVSLPGGEELRYDGLVIATGVQARHLSGAPRQDPRIHVLRTLDDAWSIRATLSRSRGRVVVIGTGFTACEIASSLRETGRAVTLVGRSATLLGGVIGEECGEAMNDFHRRNGTDLVLGVTTAGWDRRPDHVAVRLSDGRVLTASCVVVAIGSVFNTDWLRGAGIDTDGGIRCDPTCFVEGTEDVVAAGDVARWPNLRFDETPRTCQHWLNAVEMGRAAAQNLLAGRSRARPYCPMPAFWSEQYGRRIQGVGLPALATNSVPLSGKLKHLRRAVFGYDEGARRVGVIAFDQPRELLRLTLELESALPAPPRAIARAPRPTRTTAPAGPDLIFVTKGLHLAT
ncbi:NAD(P)/FAD-dependent oxidoreductase [Fodinicola acaciae]|uniref:NAD(P)/FAD-dependent oxidoreductase n=1 Tax=Fodinicola acaciae TaxID=2681555 RepID=UPI0013D79937|nr:FAD-dependent oxidoreductase [Fodinicola acaciae]